jgi:hypothetical protein
MSNTGTNEHIEFRRQVRKLLNIDADVHAFFYD